MTSGIDIGACASVTITCVSETGWHDTGRLLADIKAGGGPSGDQWRMGWDQDNAAGSCSLVEIEGLDGGRRKFLIDTGWNPDYMRQRFAATGIDRMLAEGEIEFVVLTHEHFDHFWGLQAVLEQKPDITIMIPASFGPDARRLLAGAEYSQAGVTNSVAHTGRLIEHPAGAIHPLAPGVAAVTFDLPILLGVHGEQSLFVKVADKGLVAVTGCCHQTLKRFADFALETFVGERLYGLYGGLHIAPFGPLTETQADSVRDIARYGFERIGCNHCTGLPAIELMAELGYPLLKGADGPCIGNGDVVTF